MRKAGIKRKVLVLHVFSWEYEGLGGDFSSVSSPPSARPSWCGRSFTACSIVELSFTSWWWHHCWPGPAVDRADPAKARARRRSRRLMSRCCWNRDRLASTARKAPRGPGTPGDKKGGGGSQSKHSQSQKEKLNQVSSYSLLSGQRQMDGSW